MMFFDVITNKKVEEVLRKQGRFSDPFNAVVEWNHGVRRIRFTDRNDPRITFLTSPVISITRYLSCGIQKTAIKTLNSEYILW